MSSLDNYVKLEFPSIPENVAFARTAAALFASQLDFTLDELDEIKVATSEAVSNAVIHGYDDAAGTVRLTLQHQAGELVIVVEDDGKGIDDVEWATQPANTSRPEERMGLGLVFIREYMNEVELRSAPARGTSVRMVKRPLQAGAPPAADAPRGTPVRH